MKRHWNRLMTKLSYILLDWCHKRVPRSVLSPIRIYPRVVTVCASMRVDPLVDHGTKWERHVKQTLARQLADGMLASDEIDFTRQRNSMEDKIVGTVRIVVKNVIEEELHEKEVQSVVASLDKKWMG